VERRVGITGRDDVGREGGPGRLGNRLAGAFAELATFRRFESAKGPAQEWEHALEGLGRKGGDPFVEGGPQPLVVEQDEAAPMEEAFKPGGGLGGLGTGRECESQAAECRGVGLDGVVEQAAGGGTGDQAPLTG
jgi:hypothetical protein